MPISKSDIKLIRSLSQKKFRESEGLFIVEGEKMVAEAMASDFEVVSVYRTEDIGEDDMKRISLLTTPSPALAVVRKKKVSTPTVSTSGISIALDSIHDPGNMGTIMRLADWFGIANIYASEDCVDVFNPKTVQSSMGSIFRKQVTYLPLEKVVSTYLDSDFPVYGTFLDGENIYNQSLPPENALVIMGSENNGISPEIASMITRRLFIPPFPGDCPTSESLNVAIATAIICYEFRRR